ncbi:MAG: hypothetical protein GF311_10145 [Candidatus Lokiarchaeota archaeon]|nr:hypothetical protein [Candidatus Lokiarchaeota archaeon]
MEKSDEIKSNSWYHRAKLAAEEKLPLNERIFGILIVVFCTMAILYFVAHQLLATGFFTPKFGITEMVFFYGFWLMWIITATLESILNQRFLSRIFDTFGGIIFAVIATLWLLIVFPFDFAYITDLLPGAIRFFVQWISNVVAQVIITILFVLLLVATIYSPIAYKFIEVKRLKGKKITD